MAVLTYKNEEKKILDSYGIKVTGRIGNYRSNLLGEKEVITSIVFANESGRILYKTSYNIYNCISYTTTNLEKLEAICYMLSLNTNDYMKIFQDFKSGTMSKEISLLRDEKIEKIYRDFQSSMQ